MNKILGLSFDYHDSAAALVIDGKVAAAAAEERFTRLKHDKSFPKSAIDFCLSSAGIKNINEIDAIVFYEKPTLKFIRILENFISTWPKSFKLFISKFPNYLKNNLNIEQKIKNIFPAYKGKILFSGHHLSHAAYSFYSSGYYEAAILTIDAVGESESVLISFGKDQKIKAVKSINYPHSLGLFYSAVTAYLGFAVNDGEWKVMGLAAYGKPAYKNQVLDMVKQSTDGYFELNLDFFSFHQSDHLSFNRNKWQSYFNFPERQYLDPIEQHHKDLAASFQFVLEFLLLNILKNIKQEFKTDFLVLGGGVHLNGLLNNLVAKSGLFSHVWVPPAPGDDGAAIGAALHINYMYFNNKRHFEKISPYLGPSYSDSDIETVISASNLSAVKFSKDNLTNFIAKEIASGKIIGLFNGKMEFGPRALGNRSLLADPRSAEMKNILNSKIKNRETFRPFAPIVLDEFKIFFFDINENIDYSNMSYIVSVKNEKRSSLAAITHEDGTARIQTIKYDDNPFIYETVQAFNKIAGVPVLLNTSFNLNTEPIVCSPQNAIDCFLNSKIDILVLNNYVITEKNESVDSTQLSKNFYTKNPFNEFSNSIDAANNLMKKNQIEEYPYLHDYLKNNKNLSLKAIDVGCGSGWFVNSLAHFYNVDAIGIDRNLISIKSANSIKTYLPKISDSFFKNVDLFDFINENKYDIVNSLGVLHHTGDFKKALLNLAGRVQQNGYLHIGLYHKYGRQPFLNYFDQLKKSNFMTADLKVFFSEMFPEIVDNKQLSSWYEDQVNNPVESLHTIKEVLNIIGNDFSLLATNINNYSKIESLDDLFESEKLQENIAAMYLKKNEYYPGFFTLWLKKKEFTK